MNETIGALQAYGGWACTFFLGVAILKFYTDSRKVIQEKDALIQKINECHHKEIVAVVRECTAILTTVKVVMMDCKNNGTGDGNE